MIAPVVNDEPVPITEPAPQPPSYQFQDSILPLSLSFVYYLRKFYSQSQDYQLDFSKVWKYPDKELYKAQLEHPSLQLALTTQGVFGFRIRFLIL